LGGVDRVCGKQLRPLVPILVEAMERHGHLRLAQEVRISLLAMSAAPSIGHCATSGGTREVRRAAGRLLPARSGAACRCARLTAGTIRRPGLSRRIWSRIVTSGEGQLRPNLSVTDIATGWTECAPLLVREQRLLTEVLSELRKVLPFTCSGWIPTTTACS